MTLNNIYKIVQTDTHITRKIVQIKMYYDTKQVCEVDSSYVFVKAYHLRTFVK